jgi:hypothetical protein
MSARSRTRSSGPKTMMRDISISIKDLSERGRESREVVCEQTF